MPSEFRESNAKLPKALFDALQTEGVQAIGIQATSDSADLVKELNGCTLQISDQGAYIEEQSETVLKRPVNPASQFLALKPAGGNENCKANPAAVLTIFELDRKRKAMALAEERAKSTLKDLEMQIKTHDAEEAGVRSEVARKKWEMRKELGLGGLSHPLACVAWDLGPEMEPILEEDRWAGEGKAPKKRKSGCFSHSGQKRQRKEEEEQLRPLFGSYTVEVLKPKPGESLPMAVTWTLSHASDELLEEISFQRLERGYGKDVTVKLQGDLGSALELRGKKDDESCLMLGLLVKKKQILLCKADLFSVSVFRPEVEASEKSEVDAKAYAEQRRRVTEGFGTDKRLRQHNRMRERVERQNEVAEVAKIEALVGAKIQEEKEGTAPSWVRTKEELQRNLPSFLSNFDPEYDSVDLIYADGLQEIASDENLCQEFAEKFLNKRLEDFLKMKGPQLEQLDVKMNDLEVLGFSLVLQILKARGLQGAKPPENWKMFAQKIGVLSSLLRLLQKVRGGKSSPKQLSRILGMSDKSPMLWQIYRYNFDEIEGEDPDNSREINLRRTKCAVAIWALHLVPDHWLDLPQAALCEIDDKADRAKQIFESVGCSVTKKENQTFRVALRNSPAQNEKSFIPKQKKTKKS